MRRQASLEVLNKLRSEGLVFTTAVLEARTTARTVKRYVGKALTKDVRGRIVAKKFDRIPRTLRFITPRGLITVTVDDSRVASEIARHASAVNQALLTGSATPLLPFRGKILHIGKRSHPFVTDLRTLERLAHVGEVSFEDLYALTTGEHK